MGELVSTAQLMGAKVFGGKSGTQRIGKVHCCVFHPTEKRCIGILVKRPDLMLMFHRSDQFVCLGGFDWEDGAVYLRGTAGYSGAAACKKLGVNWDDCVIWSGLSLCTKDGAVLGSVGAVVFDLQSGAVDAVVLNEGSAAGALLGRKAIPARMILGFKRGVGNQLAAYERAGAFVRGQLGDACDAAEAEAAAEAAAQAGELVPAADMAQFGALLVSDEACTLQNAGGLAERAGKASAVASHKISRVVRTVKPKVAQTSAEAGEAASAAAAKAAAAADHVVNKGAYAAGKQLGRAAGMFSAFKEEYKKARK